MRNFLFACSIFLLLLVPTCTAIKLGTKILTTITINLYDNHSNNLVPKSLVVHEGDSMDTLSKDFCDKVGALNTMQVPCHKRVLGALRESFQRRLQTELVFDLKIRNEYGVSKSFFYFKGENTNDAVLSFFYANPEFSSDSTAIATLHSAVVAQLSSLRQKQESRNEDSDLVKDDNSQAAKDDTRAGETTEDQTLLILTDHCNQFKDAHTCRMELMYGPYQLAVKNDIDSFKQSMNAEEEGKREVDENIGLSSSYAIYVILAAIVGLKIFKQNSSTGDSSYATTIIDNTKETVKTVEPTKLNALCEISTNRSFDQLVQPTKSKNRLRNTKNSAFKVHQDQENCVPELTGRKKRFTRHSKRKSIKSPLTFNGRAKAIKFSPMPRI